MAIFKTFTKKFLQHRERHPRFNLSAPSPSFCLMDFALDLPESDQIIENHLWSWKPVKSIHQVGKFIELHILNVPYIWGYIGLHKIWPSTTKRLQFNWEEEKHKCEIRARPSLLKAEAVGLKQGNGDGGSRSRATSWGMWRWARLERHNQVLLMSSAPQQQRLKLVHTLFVQYAFIEHLLETRNVKDGSVLGNHLHPTSQCANQ